MTLTKLAIHTERVKGRERERERRRLDKQHNTSANTFKETQGYKL